MQRRTDRITLKGISARGFHGVFEQEREEGQLFVADLVLEVDTRAAARSDDLAETVDYGAVSEAVVAILAGQPVNLIETLASRVAAVALHDERVQAVEVTIHKPEAPLSVPFDDVAVTVYRRNLSAPAEQDEQPVSAAKLEEADAPASRFAPASAPAEPEGEAATTAAAAPLVLPVPSALDAAAGSLNPAEPNGQAQAPAQPAADLAQHTQAADAAAQVEAEADLEAAPQSPVPVVIALGANLGEPASTLAHALDRLRHTDGLSIEQVSPLVVTEPALAPGQQAQPNYYNAVITAVTTLSPAALLAALHSVEDQFGRERQERWGARTLDLDLVDYQGTVSSAAELTLPHPRAAERAFVLYPWALIAPHGHLSGDDRTVSELSEQVGHAQILQVIEEWPAAALPGPVEAAEEAGTAEEAEQGWAPSELGVLTEPGLGDGTGEPGAGSEFATDSEFGADSEVGAEAEAQAAAQETGIPAAQGGEADDAASSPQPDAISVYAEEDSPEAAAGLAPIASPAEVQEPAAWAEPDLGADGHPADRPAFAPVVDLSALAVPAGEPLLAAEADESAEGEGGEDAALEAHPFEPIFVPVTTAQTAAEAPGGQAPAWEVPAPDPSDVPALEVPLSVEDDAVAAPSELGATEAGVPEQLAAQPFDPAMLLGEARYVDAPATMPPSFAPAARSVEGAHTIAEKAGYGVAAGVELVNDAADWQAEAAPVPAPAPPPEAGDIAPLPPLPPVPAPAPPPEAGDVAPLPPAAPLLGVDGVEPGSDDWEAKPSWDQVLGQ